MKFQITTENTEVYHLYYLVDAETEEEALNKFEAGDVEYIGDDYLSTENSSVIKCKPYTRYENEN